MSTASGPESDGRTVRPHTQTPGGCGLVVRSTQYYVCECVCMCVCVGGVKEWGNGINGNVGSQNRKPESQAQFAITEYSHFLWAHRTLWTISLCTRHRRPLWQSMPISMASRVYRFIAMLHCRYYYTQLILSKNNFSHAWIGSFDFSLLATIPKRIFQVEIGWMQLITLHFWHLIRNPLRVLAAPATTSTENRWALLGVHVHCSYAFLLLPPYR